MSQLSEQELENLENIANNEIEIQDFNNCIFEEGVIQLIVEVRRLRKALKYYAENPLKPSTIARKALEME